MSNKETKKAPEKDPVKTEAKKAPEKDPVKTEAENAPEKSATDLLEMSGEFERVYAPEIAERVAAGLTREQALEVQRNQVRSDADNEED